MGCDVHAVFEVKVDDKWEYYSSPRIQRNYNLFEKMAGVRGDVANAISPPRGLPDDISVITKIEANHYGVDGHSHSWLSREEFKELYEYQKNSYTLYGGTDWWRVDEEQYGYFFSNGFETFEPGAEGYPKEIQDLRLVFWFDN